MQPLRVRNVDVHIAQELESRQSKIQRLEDQQTDAIAELEEEKKKLATEKKEMEQQLETMGHLENERYTHREATDMIDKVLMHLGIEEDRFGTRAGESNRPSRLARVASHLANVAS